MQFAKQLRERIRIGEITCTIRVWQSPRVKIGGRYKMGDGYVVVRRIEPIDFESITPALARRSGFASVAELLRTAIHGQGRNVYWVEFRYEARAAKTARTAPKRSTRRGTSSDLSHRTVLSSAGRGSR